MDFKEFLKTLLTGLEDEYVNILLDNTAIFLNAFTHSSFNPRQNYEKLEQLGDVTIGLFIVSYANRRLFLNEETDDVVGKVARIKIKYGSGKELSNMAQERGFWPYIRTLSEITSVTRKRKILEDVFEAFIGAVHLIIDNELGLGLGYFVCYRLLERWFDQLDISTSREDLFDAKTRLKEIFDANRLLGTLRYEHEKENNTIRIKIVRTIGGEDILMAQYEEQDAPKADVEQAASKLALEYIKEKIPAT